MHKERLDGNILPKKLTVDRIVHISFFVLFSFLY